MTGKVIIYDDACPMCRAYTAGFVRIGILEPQGRVGFAKAETQDLARLDTDRARHEIPLLDRATGEVVYGLDALFLLIGSRFPLLRPARLLKGALTPLYRYISYNRRVIAGCAPAPLTANRFDCAPDFRRDWRIGHLVISAMGWVVGTTAFCLKVANTIGHGFAVAIAILFLLHLFLVVYAQFLMPHRCGLWERAGNLGTNALAFGLLLMIGLPWIQGMGWIVWLLATATITAWDFRRRLHPQRIRERVARGISLPVVQSQCDDSPCHRCR